MKLIGIIDAHHDRSPILAARKGLKRPRTATGLLINAVEQAQAETLGAIQRWRTLRRY
ncbi:MAG: hypothetical protein JNL19_15945 [Burkholderiales bacterium]|nr:hypothetical protein [Burkholderiales bacterium]